MAYQIFVSYRRDGGEALACLISEKLKQSGFETFYDVDSLRSGKFNEEIFRVIDSCTDVIVVLPQNGLDRCQNEGDWVRKEIAYSIKADKNIIPVMMRNFEFPPELPQEINDLRHFNGISANMEYFDAAFAKLLTMIKASNYLDKDSINQLTDDDELRNELLKCIEELEHNSCAANKTALADCYARLHNDSLSEKIAKLYAQAADLGYAPAQNALGDCYYYGKGVEENIERAFEWYKNAAEQGLCEAQCNLAFLFKNYSEELAFIWMKKAANKSYPKALYEMGNFYEYGIGINKNWNRAKKYYAKAEEKGYALASEKTIKKYWRLKPFRNFFYDFTGNN